MRNLRERDLNKLMRRGTKKKWNWGKNAVTAQQSLSVSSKLDQGITLNEPLNMVSQPFYLSPLSPMRKIQHPTEPTSNQIIPSRIQGQGGKPNRTKKLYITGAPVFLPHTPIKKKTTVFGGYTFKTGNFQMCIPNETSLRKSIIRR